PRHVLDRAVGGVGVDGELLAALAVDDAAIRDDRDLRHGRIARAAVGQARGDPPADDRVLLAAEFHLLAAAVRDLADRLRRWEATVVWGEGLPAGKTRPFGSTRATFGSEAV